MKTSAARVPITRSSASRMASGARCSRAGSQVADAPPKHPEPLDQDGLLNLFSAETTGAGVVLEPASMADMCGGEVHEKPSLEVIYDNA
jgi:chlorophyllide a reductase subunit X